MSVVLHEPATGKARRPTVESLTAFVLFNSLALLLHSNN